MLRTAALAVLLGAALAAPSGAESPPDFETPGRLARLALDCVHREYPNKIAHVLQEDADARPPRALTPAFYGCYDWHSAVHGHWLLARLARLHPDAPWAADARAALARNLTPENLAAEVAYLQGEGRGTFERPYGLAWLLQLDAELTEWAREAESVPSVAPLAAVAADRFREWLPKLSHPIRTGEHSQTAFAFGLVWDWAQTTGDTDLVELLIDRVQDLYLQDRACPLSYEPSGQDFLSPCLAEADLVRRLLPPTAFAAWLGSFLPQIPLTANESAVGPGGRASTDGRAVSGAVSRPVGEATPDGPAWLPVAVVTDPTDGKLAHLDGLNLSRAWMLDGIAHGLPADDPRRRALTRAARAHRDSGVAAVTGEHYEGGHWLASFATYLMTGRGLSDR